MSRPWRSRPGRRRLGAAPIARLRPGCAEKGTACRGEVSRHPGAGACCNERRTGKRDATRCSGILRDGPYITAIILCCGYWRFLAQDQIGPVVRRSYRSRDIRRDSDFPDDGACAADGVGEPAHRHSARARQPGADELFPANTGKTVRLRGPASAPCGGPHDGEPARPAQS